MTLLYRIQNGIENGGLPLADIYNGFEAEQLEKRGFCQILKSGKPEALAQAVEAIRAYLPEECASCYGTLAKTLGKSASRKTESTVLARYIGEISALEKKYAVEDEAKCVLYRKLGILCGLFAALILL